MSLEPWKVQVKLGRAGCVAKRVIHPYIWVDNQPKALPKRGSLSIICEAVVSDIQEGQLLANGILNLSLLYMSADPR